jgi:hypothetical protein
MIKPPAENHKVRRPVTRHQNIFRDDAFNEIAAGLRKRGTKPSSKDACGIIADRMETGWIYAARYKRTNCLAANSCGVSGLLRNVGLGLDTPDGLQV